MSDSNTDAASTDAKEAESPSDSENNESSAADETAAETTPFLDAIRAPIDEAAPAGDDVLYDENFQELKTEINKISSAGGAADYERVTDLARTILTEQSKDLRAAGYLVVGAAREQGVDEAAEAMRAVQVLIDEYWEELYPDESRMRSRGNALQFIGDRLPDWLQSASFEPDDRPALNTLLESLEEVQAFSMEEMGEHAPSLSGLLNELEDHVSDLPAPEPESGADESEPEDAEPTSESEATSSTSTDAAGAEASPAETNITSETEAAQMVRTVAGYYREDDLTHPAPYRLMRTMRWESLQSAPPNEGGTTRFQAPREQRREYLKGLLDDGEYETLVREGESSFQSGTFHVWLDLQRLIATALDALGDPYREARQAVLVDVAVLVDRVPSLLSLTFQDGTPFASPLTVDWIEADVQSQLGGDESSAEGASDGDELSEVEADLEEARTELNGGSLERALSIIRTATGQAPSKKEVFHRQFHAASLCVKGEKPVVARPILDDLAEVIEEHTLDRWDPALALEVWTARCQCYDRLAQETDSEEQSQQFRAEAEVSFDRICEIDPAHAVTVAGRRPGS